MRRNITLAFVLLFSFILQTTLFQKLNFGGISPNLLIIVTATYGFMFDVNYGIIVGFVCGLLMDVFYGEDTHARHRARTCKRSSPPRPDRG